MLGAGAWRQLVHVTVPAVAPGIAVAALFAFLISWSEYISTLLVGGGTVHTLPLLLFAAIGSSDLTAVAALALVIAVPPVLLLGFTARFLTGDTPAVVGFDPATLAAARFFGGVNEVPGTVTSRPVPPGPVR